MAYRPTTPFNVAMKLLTPEWQNVSGVNKKVYPDPDTIKKVFFGNFRTFGGTEREDDGVFSIENTATVETWYRPDITSDCCVYIIPAGQIYEILGDPENIELRNQFLKFKVRRIGGRA